MPQLGEVVTTIMPSGAVSRTRSCFREVVGRPVVDLSSGNEMGVIKDCLFNQEESRLLGLRVGGRGPARGDYTLDFASIRSLGGDAITVESASSLIPGGDAPPGSCGDAKPSISVLGKRVMSEAGRDAGVIRDVSVDAETGAIVGYEVSESLIMDFLAGRQVIPWDSFVTVGEETVVIPDDTEPHEQD